MEKITNGHPLSQSPDYVAENIATLKQLFPTIVKEGKIDLKELQALLGNEVETEEEYYRFTWAGKSQARREANKPSTATLRPDKASSKDWDTTENIFIEGDNLEVLKLLQKSYANKVKMIYIDPPYNTGKDFVYKDNYNDNLSNYLSLTGQVDEEGKRISTNSESDGRYHSNWLNMIYPRLKLARNLLAENGIIYISIDDNEIENLRKVCDEIFGEENFRNYIITRRRVKSLNVQFADNGLRTMNVGFEFVLAYSKSDKFLFKPLRMQKQNASTKGTWNVFWSGADRPSMRYELLGFTPQSGQWRWSSEKAIAAIRNYETYLQNHSANMSLEDYWQQTGESLKFIRRIPDGEGKNGGVQYWIPPSETSLRTSNWTDIEVSQIQKEFDIPFENPKATKLIQTLIDSIQESSFIVLDFFAGSGTTAHAVMQLNAEDGGNRKFICVQLPEPTDEKSEAYKAGYKNISDITKERIRRAGDKILAEQKDDLFSETGKKLDVGFRAFKLDSSNINAWDGNPDSLEKNLFNAAQNIKEDRTEEDVLYEILLKYGLDLTQKIEERKVAGKVVFNVGGGALFICLGNNLTTAIAEGIAQWKNELQPAITRVVFKDTGFTDVEKTNSMQILKRHGINEVHTI